MCGRFAVYSSLDTLKKTFSIQTVTCTFQPCYNIAPARAVHAVISRHGKRRLGLLTWGFVPQWTKKGGKAQRIINARIESLADKPLFQHALHARRCIIPADGFYEWKEEAGRKQPWYITSSEKKPFAFAGLWDRGEKDSGGAPSSCCTILTTRACAELAHIHDRMPVLLGPQAVDAWLGQGALDAQTLVRIHLDSSTPLTGYPVSTAVNSTRSDSPACITPLDSGKHP